MTAIRNITIYSIFRIIYVFCIQNSQGRNYQFVNSALACKKNMLCFDSYNCKISDIFLKKHHYFCSCKHQSITDFFLLARAELTN